LGQLVSPLRNELRRTASRETSAARFEFALRMSYVENLDEVLRSTTIQPEQGPNQGLSVVPVGGTVRPPIPSIPSSSSDYSPSNYRATSIITVHRRPYTQQDFSDSSSDSDLDENFDDLPSPSSSHAVVIGNYVNVGT